MTSPEKNDQLVTANGTRPNPHSALRIPHSFLPLLLLGALMAAGLLGLDRTVLAWVGAHVTGEWHELAEAVGRCGRSVGYIAPTALLLAWWFWVRPWRAGARICLWLLAAEATCGIVTRLLKVLFGRWRPEQWLDKDRYGFEFFQYAYKRTSFPSGHAADAFAVATVLWFAWPRLRPLWASWALLMAAARVLSLDHFVSDVSAGAIVGFLCALAWRRRLAADGRTS